MGKSTIAIFNSELLAYQRVPQKRMVYSGKSQTKMDDK